MFPASEEQAQEPAVESPPPVQLDDTVRAGGKQGTEQEGRGAPSSPTEWHAGESSAAGEVGAAQHTSQPASSGSVATSLIGFSGHQPCVVQWPPATCGPWALEPWVV